MFEPDSLSRVASVIGLVAMVVAVVALVVAHLRPTGLSPLRNPVSQYGISVAAPLYRVQTIAMAVAALDLTFCVQRDLHGPGTGEIEGCLVVFAVARALISWFPMDAPGAARSRHGSTHGLLAIATFLSVVLAANRLNRILASLASGTEWSHVSGIVSLTLTVSLALVLVARLSGTVRPFFGIIERLFYVSCISWIVVTCWAFAFLHKW